VSFPPPQLPPPLPPRANTRRRLQRRPRRSRSTSLYPVTNALIAINLGIYVTDLLLSYRSSWSAGQLTELQYRMVISQQFIDAGEWYRLLSAGFVHFGVFHVAMNMLLLYQLGRLLEPTIGSPTFGLVYFASLLGGSAGALVASPNALTGGASGAVFGVMVAFAMLYPTAPIMLLLLPPIQARYVVAGLIALDILFLTANDNVARVVHLGGAASGWVLMRYYSTGGMDRLASLFSKWKRPSGPKNKRMRSVVDATIIEEIDQSEIDRILDKIAQKGYSSLSAEEKKRLFDSSKR
jgi:membrane associated rhomboid family serine protease